MNDVNLLLTITGGLSAAFVLGLAARRLGLSPIVGYVLAGVLVGPHTPGFVANQQLASQAAELGVILLMFSVGLRFSLQDLLRVRSVALPGALVGSAVAATVTTAAASAIGFGLTAGAVLGMALAVSSTVVIVRVLGDADLLDSPAGHVAVGWTVTEDLISVLVLVLLPVLFGTAHQAATGPAALAAAIGLALGKVGLVAVLLLVGGAWTIPRLLQLVARTRSPELFTLAVLVIALVVASGAAAFFGVSLALGAFLAGIVVGQSRLSVQAAADALPLRDAFAVLFFVSIGMLFDPATATAQPRLLLLVLAVVLLLKPLLGLLLALALRASFTSAVTVGASIAQIGEFSFIVAQLGRAVGVLPAEGYAALVAAALLSIALNPLLVRATGPLERALRRRAGLWRLLNRRAEGHASRASTPPAATEVAPLVIVGYGPVGRTSHRIAADLGVRVAVIETNADTINELGNQGVAAFFGDATRREVLLAAGLRRARYLLVTIPDLPTRIAIIGSARLVAPELEIITRARYLQERTILEEAGADVVCFEETEAAVALAGAVLQRVGASPEAIAEEGARIRQALGERS